MKYLNIISKHNIISRVDQYFVDKYYYDILFDHEFLPADIIIHSKNKNLFFEFESRDKNLVKNILTGLNYLEARLFYDHIEGIYKIPKEIFLNFPIGFCKIKILSSEPLLLDKLIIANINKNSFFKLNLKINLHSGIGDCLRILSLHKSLEIYAKKYGVRVYWTYAANSMQDNGWKDLLKDQILGRSEYFEYISEQDFESLNVTEITNGHQDSGNIYFRDIFKNEIIGFDVGLKFQELEEIYEILGDGINIGIQLSGNAPEKKYSDENFIELFRLIFDKYPTSRILLIDRPGYAVNQSLLFDNRVISLVGKISMAQTINLISNLDLLIAPDSYSKYIANWSSTKQIIQCCRISTISDEALLKYCFHNVGLCFNSSVNLLGVTYSENLQSINFIDSINNIDPSEILSFIDF